MRTNALLLFSICVFATSGLASDTTYIKVHFLHGSKPKKEFQAIEPRWFGGIHGGHVGIEVDSNVIMDFLPAGKFHFIAHKKQRHSNFAIHTGDEFWRMMGSDSNSVKRTTIIIPIDTQQKFRLDSIFHVYTDNTPYDYAFIGMRCPAAAYDVLSQLGVVRRKGHHATYLSIFYPKVLRKARNNNWTVVKHEGVDTRIWEE